MVFDEQLQMVRHAGELALCLTFKKENDQHNEDLTAWHSTLNSPIMPSPAKHEVFCGVSILLSCFALLHHEDFIDHLWDKLGVYSPHFVVVGFSLISEWIYFNNIGSVCLLHDRKHCSERSRFISRFNKSTFFFSRRIYVHCWDTTERWLVCDGVGAHFHLFGAALNLLQLSKLQRSIWKVPGDWRQGLDWCKNSTESARASPRCVFHAPSCQHKNTTMFYMLLRIVLHRVNV